MESGRQEELGLRDVHAVLETAYLEEYLASLGQSLGTVRYLPAKEAEALMAAASRFASMKLAEVEMRSRFVENLHDVSHKD